MEVGCCDRREGEGCVRAGGGQGRRAISRLACRQQAPKAVNLIVGGTATLAATAMYLAKYLTKNDALALTEEDGDDGLPPLLVDLYVLTRHCLDQALTEHLPFVDLHVLTIHCLDQALTKHSPFVDLHVLTRHCLDQALTKYLPFVDLHVLKRHCLDQALTKHSLVVWIPMF